MPLHFSEYMVYMYIRFSKAEKDEIFRSGQNIC